jgi:hypothetical protein
MDREERRQLDRLLTRRQIEGAALIGIDVAKEADLGEWYQQVITKGQMISYYDVCTLNSHTG